MSGRTFTSIVPYVEHKPEVSIEDDGAGGKHAVEIPGFLVLGFEVDGVKVPLLTRKAGGVFADMKRHQLAQNAAAAQAPPEPPAA